MRYQPFRRALRSYFFRRLTERQGFGLSKDVCHECVVMPSYRIQRAAESDEVTRNEPGALMYQLIEGVLAVGAGFAPVNRTCCVGDSRSIDGNTLAVTFHCQLLQICRETFHVLVIGQYGDGGSIKTIAVPDRKESHQDWNISLERCAAKMFVDLVEAVEHRPKVVRTDGDHGGQADGRCHGIPASDPVPEFEHVCTGYTELCHGIRV